MPLRGRVNYHLTRVFILLSLVVIFITALQTWGSFQFDVQNYLKVYHFTLNNLVLNDIQQPLEDSRRQINVVAKSIMTEKVYQNQSVINDYWVLADKIQNPRHHIFFYNLLFNTISSYPEFTQPTRFDATNRPWFIGAKQKGVSLVGPYLKLNSKHDIFTMIRRIYGHNRQLIGLLMVDINAVPLQYAMDQSLRDNRERLFLLNHLHHVLMETGSGALPPLSHTTDRDNDPTLLQYGYHMTVNVLNQPWTLNLYIPPEVFREMLMSKFKISVVPIISLLAVFACSLYFLLLVVRQEQLQLNGAIREISGQTPLPPLNDRHTSHWFIQDSLSEIECLRDEYLHNKHELYFDPLTRVKNRRAFERDFSSLCNRGKSFQLLLIDVDYFKQLNDKFGHQFGDLVLSRVGAILRSLWGHERVYRYGGDEFAVLTKVRIEVLRRQLDACMEMMASRPLRETQCHISLSIGVAGSEEAPINELFELADKRLYMSKQRGRRCYTLPPETD